MNKLVGIRSEFPILEKKIMLSSCSQSAISRKVLEAMEAYKNSLIEEGMSWDVWMDKVNSAKGKFAELINCSPDEIAILSSVSDSISTILHTLDLNTKEVCVTEMDFPCIGHAVLAQQRLQNFNITFIPVDNNVIPLEYYEKFISEKTALTCIPHVSYYNGFKQDIKEIAKIAHDKGSLLLVDAYQSAGSMGIDVKDMDIDILVTGMQKYLLGVPGLSFLYVKKEISEQLSPSTIGWFGQKNPFAFNLNALELAESTQRFNTGTPPVVNAYIADAALSHINEIGIKTIEHHLNHLSSYTIETAAEMGFHIASPLDIQSKGASNAIYVEDANTIEQLLKEQGIIVSARKDVIRIAPHIYNTKEDIYESLVHLRRLTQ